EGEGIARDVVRVVQAARRAAGLDVSDRIRVTGEGDEQVVLAVQSHSELVAGEVLAGDGAVAAAPGPEADHGSGKVAARAAAGAREGPGRHGRGLGGTSLMGVLRGTSGRRSGSRAEPDRRAARDEW